MPTVEELHRGFRLGDWEVLPAQGVLRSGDQEQKPEPKVLKVLLALASRDGDVVTRDELIDEVWAGRPTSDEPINRCLSQLRGHLGDKERPHQYIETLSRRGYRLNKKVELLAADDSATAPAAPAARRSKRGWLAAAGVIIALLVAFVLRDGPFVPADDEINSIGVLPFDNLSGEASDQYLVSGFKEELVQTLNNIEGLGVKHGRIAYPDEEVTDIADILDVDALLFGALQRDGDTLKINYTVARGRDGVTLSSGSVTGRLESIFELQERLAFMVRNDLLGESRQQLISSNRPASFAAYDRYMLGMYTFERRGYDNNLEEAIALFQEAIDIDPEYGPAYLSLATAYALLPDYRDAPLDETHQLAIDTVERGIAVDDSIRDAASAVFGFVSHKRKEWAEAEQAYIRATAAQVVDSNAFNWYSRMLASVGRTEDALYQVLAAHRIDPDSAMINTRVAMVYTWLENAEKAAEFYERAGRLGASSQNQLLGNALLLLRDGRAEEASRLARTGLEIAGASTVWVEPAFAAVVDETQRDTALRIINEVSAAEGLDPRVEITMRAWLGDIDGAMRVANLLVQPGEIFEMDLLFLPELKGLRQDPDFMDLMTKLGVKAYWDEHDCVWQGDHIDCPESFQ